MMQKKNPILAWLANEATADIAFSWLLHLRWGAVFCQTTLIVAAYSYLEIAIPIIFVSTILIFEAGSNLFFAYLYRQKKVVPEWLFGLVMFLDIIFLTALLYYTGGPMNPFTFLYLVHIVLGTVRFYLHLIAHAFYLESNRSMIFGSCEKIFGGFDNFYLRNVRLILRFP